jgi:hypothetical protein
LDFIFQISTIIGVIAGGFMTSMNHTFKNNDSVIDKRSGKKYRVSAVIFDDDNVWVHDGEEYFIMPVQELLLDKAAVPKAALKNACTCGASHTSFPNHHARWCDLGAP